MKRSVMSINFKYFLLLSALISIFATCRKMPADNEGEKPLSKNDPENKEEEEIHIDTKQPEEEFFVFKKKSEIQYQFKRDILNLPQNFFHSPVENEIQVAGSFCELRGNHFHGGLDIRTGGVEGWNILASADGYIERILVSTKGYGKALYIRHPNGYTSVYGHLSAFHGAIKNYVVDAQYKNRKVELELFPLKNELVVKQGQIIALSGNTGGSGGPHLHFEIRNPSGLATNPLSYGIPVKDVINPEIKNIALFEQREEILHSHGYYPYKIVSKSLLETTDKVVKVAPGSYSTAILADDYFTDKRNKMGINYAWCTINGHLLFEYQINKMDFNQGRYINTHIDYYLKYLKGHTYFRMFKPPYNLLKYYKHANSGVIQIADQDTFEYKIFIQDYAGLTDSAKVYLIGDANTKPFEPNNLPFHTMSVNVDHKQGKNFSIGPWNISIPPKVLYHSTQLLLSEKPKPPLVLSEILQFHYGFSPLHNYVNLSFLLNDELKKWGNKLCAVSIDGSKLIYEGGNISGDRFHFKTRSFGIYGLAKDDTPPSISPIKTGKQFSFKVSDNLSGISNITCLLDDRWILYDYEPKTNSLKGEIPAWIKPGTYSFTVVATDKQGNKSESKHSITLN